MEINLISTWMGKPIENLSREEMIDVINYCAKEIQSLKDDRNRWRASGDSVRYLMTKNTI